MLRTEEEAIKAICPLMSRENIEWCEASRCMAWRWSQKINPSYKPANTMQGIYPHIPDPTPMYIADETRGFCGLAGRPS